MEPDSILKEIQDSSLEAFQRRDRLCSFREFLEDFCREPYLYLRSAAQYALEMFEHFGSREVHRIGRDAQRFGIFDAVEENSLADIQLVGQERAQNAFYSYLKSFARQGRIDKMILLHGPNGSGKTSFVECLVHGLERFSQTPRGALLRFNWIFSEREEHNERIGFEKSLEETAHQRESLANLDEAEISARISCELNDPPLFLIPREKRGKLIRDAIELYHARTEAPPRTEFNLDHFLEGDLCQKCRKIFDALLTAHQGDWMKVVRHVQVERYAISKRYRVGAVTIEPQGNVDASVQPIHSERHWHLPSILRNLSLYEPVGDIIEANHGILEYSDFLKRPLEVSKYLLTTCERGTVNLPHFMAYLDMIIVGTTNEKHLSLFKRSPDFSSFKGRIELVPVPYLLMVSKEKALYESHIRLFSRDRHVTPHTAEIAATWAVLTRLRRPKSENYSGALARVVGQLSPIEKARLYDQGGVPSRFTEEEQKALRSGVTKIREEFEESEGEFEGLYSAEYEGRRGASAREMMTMLGFAAENRNYDCLTPMAVFTALEELCKDPTLYDFLRLPLDGDYHDVKKFTQLVREQYVKTVSEEVYNCIGLIDESEYSRFFLEYFRHVKAYGSRERIYNASTNSYEAPNEELMASVERKVGVSEPREVFRSNIMTRIAAWALDHPQQPIDYHKLFPNILAALLEDFYRDRNRMLTLIEQDILKFGSEDFALLSSDDQKQVRDVLQRMQSRYGYCQNCAKDVIAFVLKNRQ
jgi:predicted Ser/Thr protein kinase